MKRSVQAVILNGNNEILCVSRKDNHNDFGFPGGSVEEFDNTLEDALKREIFEETGLNVNMETSIMVFSMFKGNNMGYTYLIKDWEGILNSEEPHIIKWSNYQTVLDGKFGIWNKLVLESLTNMGIKIKL